MSNASIFRYFKTSPEIIRLAVMMSVRYPLSLRNVEDLLHERGIDITHETVRFWWNRFGTIFAAEIPRSRVQAMRHFRHRRWLLNGVTMFDPRQTFIDVDVRIAQDVTLLPGTILQGHTVIGAGCEIGPNTRLVDCTVGEGSTVDSTVAVNAAIGNHATVGPFAHLTSGSRIADGRHTGAFYDSSKDNGPDTD